MGKNFTAAFAVCLAISSLPLACGDDEEPGDGGGDGKGGKGGTTATGGASGSSTGGKATGGSPTGGAPTGGRGGTPTGGTTATGGTAGIGGADGGIGGADGGIGGEAGGGTTMTQCERLCAKAAQANCTDNSTCEFNVCESFLPGNSCDDEGQAYLDCLDAGPASNFTCFKDKPAYNFGTGLDCDDEAYAALTCVP